MWGLNALKANWQHWRGRPTAATWPGVNLVGYATGGLGLGETLRRFAEVLEQHGLAHAVVDVDVNLGGRARELRLAGRVAQDNPHPVSLLFVNADQMSDVKRHLGARFFQDRVNIGYWFWELERFPPAWSGAFSEVDHVWAATRFVRDALAPWSAHPVHLVPHPVPEPAVAPLGAGHFGLPEAADERACVFLSVFDFHSYLSRKNPWAVIRSFRQAFARGDEKVSLILKSINGAQAPELMATLAEAAQGDRRIRFMDTFMPHRELMALMKHCDVLVSLHRSEGFGQGLAEAMLLGKPVVATGYSGNLDFMSEDNSVLVSARLVPLGADDYPCGQGQVWAEPNEDEAAAAMVKLAGSPSLRRTLGLRARASVQTTNGGAACVQALIQGLAMAGVEGPGMRQA
jgi:glycosyltransferase involved in cell wall biosynthesis